jgi:hypothetical protein
MFYRLLLLLFGLGVVTLVGLYLATGRERYLRGARTGLAVGLGLACVFFLVLLLKRLI